jgi:hypothetical protein
MAKKKGNCPRCGGAMKLAHRFCTGCGAGNPLLTAPARRRGAQAVKSAAASYAPVADLGAVQRARMWAAYTRNPDPDSRERAFEVVYKSLGGGAA